MQKQPPLIIGPRRSLVTVLIYCNCLLPRLNKEDRIAQFLFSGGSVVEVGLS